MKWLKGLAFAGLLFGAVPAFAAAVDVNGFSPQSVKTTIAVTSTSAAVALNNAGVNNTIVFHNTSTVNQVTVKFGADNTVAAIDNDFVIPAGAWLTLNAKQAAYVAAKTPSSTANLDFWVGVGNAPMFVNVAPGVFAPVYSLDGSGNLQPASAATPVPVIICDIHGNCTDFTLGSPVTQSGTWTVQPGNTTACSSTLPISQVTSTDLHTMVTTGYICAIVLVIADAEGVSLTEGAGTLCNTGASALIGSTTVANGLPISANGGFSAISAMPWLKMAVAADHLCLLQSGSGRLSGVITYSDH